MKYLKISNNSELPESICPDYFKCIVIVECDVKTEWQKTVSEWLIHSGCRYMMAWGKECSSWDDSLDIANIEKFNYEDIPKEDFVITTWHEDESLQDVLWYSKYSAFHEYHDLATIILHISETSMEDEITEKYNAA
jgi:hypothetical protein